ncbi:MAG: hypothetical protein RLZZ23_1065 [Verrucomicrobiota bacterium]
MRLRRSGVREREQQAGGAAGGEKGAGLVIKLGDGFTFGAVEDPDAGQREFSADAGAKGLARCLLGGEARGEGRIRVDLRKAELLFGGSEDLVEESGAMLHVRGADAIDLREIHADTYHVAAFKVHTFFVRFAFISATELRMPVKSARATIEWPIFNSFR